MESSLEPQVYLGRIKRQYWGLVSAALLAVSGVAMAIPLPFIAAIQPSVRQPIFGPFVLLVSVLLILSACILIFQRHLYSLKIKLLFPIACLILGWGLFVFILNLEQNKLVFSAPKLSAQVNKYLHTTFPNSYDLSIQAPDHTQLRGWINRTTPSNHKLVIYFGGNNEFVPPEFLNTLHDWDFAMVNYRGYGESEGKSSIQTIMDDSLTVYDNLKQGYTDVVLIGRSLGTGAAITVASERSVQGVVFISPFDKFNQVMLDQLPLFPSPLIQNRFDSKSLATSIHSSALCLIGEMDRTIRPIRSQILMNKWAGPKLVKWIPNTNHNSILSSPILSQNIDSFLESL